MQLQIQHNSCLKTTEKSALFLFVASRGMWVSAFSQASHSVFVCSQVWGTAKKINVSKDFWSDELWKAKNTKKVEFCIHVCWPEVENQTPLAMQHIQEKFFLVLMVLALAFLEKLVKIHQIFLLIVIYTLSKLKKSKQLALFMNIIPDCE